MKVYLIYGSENDKPFMQPARDYLARRGLSDAALERWEIGFAPDMRHGVLDHLKSKSVPEDLIIDAGLAARPDDGGAP